jgi:DNA-binding transcriptional MocR family regulator
MLAEQQRGPAERQGRLRQLQAADAPGCELETVPAGGVHLWLRLPDRFSDADVADAAAARRLAVSPSRACYPGEPPGEYLRLSYAAEEAPSLIRGVEILAGILGMP